MIGIEKTIEPNAEYAVFADANGINPISCKIDINPAQPGTGRTSPTNIRPISGHSQAKIYSAQKNLFTLDFISYKKIFKANILQMTDKNSFYLTGANGGTETNQLIVGNGAYVIIQLDSLLLPPLTYVTLTCKVKNYTDLNGKKGYIQLGYIKNQSDNMWSIIDTAEFSTVGETDITITGRVIDRGFLLLKMTPVNDTSNVTLSQYTEVTDMQIELGQEASAYEKFSGNIETISLPSTVYGSKIKINNDGTGELTDDRNIVDLGTLTWTYDSDGGYFYSNDISDMVEDTQNILCSIFANASTGANRIETSGQSLHVYTSTYADAAELTTALDGQKLVYEIEPTISELSSLPILTNVGVYNTMWSSLWGNFTSITYITAGGETSELIESGNPKHIRITFLLDGTVFEDEDLDASTGCTITTYMNPDTDMTFGVAFMSELNLSFFRSIKTDELNWIREFKVELGVEDNGVTNWTQIGLFAGKRPLSITDYTINFTAYDRMQRFDKSVGDFMSLLTYPCTLQDVYDKLCSFVSVTNVPGDEIQDIMSRTFSSAFDISGMNTCRDLLAKIAEATGCYARITPTGEAQFIWYADHVDEYSIKRNNIFSVESTDLTQSSGLRWNDLEDVKWSTMANLTWGEMYYRENVRVYEGVVAKWSDPEEEYTQPSTLDVGARTYLIENNPFVHYSTEQDIRDHLQLILDRLITFNIYYVANIVTVGNWTIEPGDIIGVEMEDGTYKTYPIFSRVLTWNGYCGCNYESTGNLV